MQAPQERKELAEISQNLKITKLVTQKLAIEREYTIRS
jgi:hypothetical protein